MILEIFCRPFFILPLMFVSNMKHRAQQSLVDEKHKSGSFQCLACVGSKFFFSDSKNRGRWNCFFRTIDELYNETKGTFIENWSFFYVQDQYKILYCPTSIITGIKVLCCFMVRRPSTWIGCPKPSDPSQATCLICFNNEITKKSKISPWAFREIYMFNKHNVAINEKSKWIDVKLSAK